MDEEYTSVHCKSGNDLGEDGFHIVDLSFETFQDTNTDEEGEELLDEAECEELSPQQAKIEEIIALPIKELLRRARERNAKCIASNPIKIKT